MVTGCDHLGALRSQIAALALLARSLASRLACRRVLLVFGLHEPARPFVRSAPGLLRSVGGVRATLCLALQLPFNPQRGGGALYVIAVTLIVTLVEARPWLQNEKQQNPKIAQQQQPVARLEAAD